jgi:hypothetical protein
MTRACGSCQLCCKLLPVGSVGKEAGERCKYQRHHKGCAVYVTLMSVSPECSFWSCRWLVENDTADLSRPDRSHYVIDMMPDFVTRRDDASGKADPVQVVQIWVDPGFPDAWRDPRLRAYLERRAKDNVAGLVRLANDRAIAIFPPALSHDGQWREVETKLRTQTHTFAEVVRALSIRATP